MRSSLLMALLVCFGVAIASCGDSGDRSLNNGEHNAVDNKSVNTVDPVTGDKVDPNIAPVSAKGHDGKQILIGASSADSAATIKKDPDKYVDAALADQKSEAK